VYAFTSDFHSTAEGSTSNPFANPRAGTRVGQESVGHWKDCAESRFLDLLSFVQKLAYRNTVLPLARSMIVQQDFRMAPESRLLGSWTEVTKLTRNAFSMRTAEWAFSPYPRLTA
jgi:hypothetical protein